jgi:hypothetical protein
MQTASLAAGIRSRKVEAIAQPGQRSRACWNPAAYLIKPISQSDLLESLLRVMAPRSAPRARPSQLLAI